VVPLVARNSLIDEAGFLSAGCTYGCSCGTRCRVSIAAAAVTAGAVMFTVNDLEQAVTVEPTGPDKTL
jgi:hypothetical protein